MPRRARQFQSSSTLDHLSNFTPVPALVPNGVIAELAHFMRGHKALVLTGAGISTDSGIPDYRGPKSIRIQRRPIWYRDFVDNADARRRYWSRSAIGWPKIGSARPNGAHRVLAEMEKARTISGIVTQNVDGLHQTAGSLHVLELHGSLANALCLQCRRMEPRDLLQNRLLLLNPGWEKHSASAAPDGDAELPREVIDSFKIPSCRHCGGVMKPDVTFFGENAQKDRVKNALSMLEHAEALLVLGSSLAVYSGYRFPLKAIEQSKPVLIVNAGPTRADHLATVRISGYLADVLPRLRATL